MPEDVKKTYTAEEHAAILASRVETETASLTAENTQLKADLAEAQNKLDAADSAKLAAEQARETAVQELATFKAETEKAQTAEARKGERVTAVKAKCAAIKDEWFDAEVGGTKRIDRIVAMADEEFAGYLEDIASFVPTTESREVPRESAALLGQPIGGDQPKVSAAEDFLLRGYVAPTQTGA